MKAIKQQYSDSEIVITVSRYEALIITTLLGNFIARARAENNDPSELENNIRDMFNNLTEVLK